MLRGLYNTNFNNISKKKEYNEIIEGLLCFCYENIRLRIWNKRCEEVAEIEEKRGLKKSEKKKRKKDRRGTEDEEKQGKIRKMIKTKENIEKEKNLENNIRLVTKDQIIQEITDGKSIKNKLV